MLLYWIVCSRFLLASFGLEAQAEPDPVAALQLQLSAADAEGMARWFNDEVELGINGQKTSYLRVQAGYVVKDYFRKHPPGTFTLLRQSEANKASRFLIGKYERDNHYTKVFVQLNRHNGRYSIDLLDLSTE